MAHGGLGGDRAAREAVYFDHDASAFANDDFRVFHFKVGRSGGPIWPGPC